MPGHQTASQKRVARVSRHTSKEVIAPRARMAGKRQPSGSGNMHVQKMGRNANNEMNPMMKVVEGARKTSAEKLAPMAKGGKRQKSKEPSAASPFARGY